MTAQSPFLSPLSINTIPQLTPCMSVFLRKDEVECESTLVGSHTALDAQIVLFTFDLHRRITF